MKELDPISQDKELTKTEIQAEQEKKKEVILIGKQRRIPTLTLWEYNTKNHTITPATFSKQDVVLESINELTSINSKISLRVDTREDCVYVQALNIKNAVKKLSKNKLL